MGDYDEARIALGLPDGSRDLEVEKSLLIESGFNELNGVDWDKGCYMGQELTARTHYRATIVPRLWFLGLTTDHRIFQNLSVLQIIEQILKEQNFTGDTFAFKCFFDYAPREYCVQYGETALHFISRLCEEEGIYFYFEHHEDRHVLCFSDMQDGPRDRKSVV